MEIRQLELFLAVLETASVTKAAQKMHLSPGAVSLQLHNLAVELRTELFVRSGKRIVPAPAAERLAVHARAILRQVRQIEQEFENDPALDTRPFHFVTGASALLHRLGKPLRLLRKQYPKTVIQVTVAATEDMVAGLLDRKFDLALLSLPCDETGLSITPVYDEEMLILGPAPASVRGWHVENILPEQLTDKQFLLYPHRSNMRAIIDAFFSELGLKPQVAMEADDTEAIKRLVESGFGYSVLPEFALHSPQRFFHLYRIKGRKLVRRQALARVQSEYPRALTESIEQFLLQALSAR